jgi:hypothetical protein
MATSKKQTTKKDPLERELAQLRGIRAPVVTMEPLDAAGSDERLRAGWLARCPMFEKGLDRASEGGRALFARAKAFADSGMPLGPRPADEQAAFFTIAAGAAIQNAPRWPDFIDRWLASGGLAYAIEVALQLPVARHHSPNTEVALLPGVTDLYTYWVLAALRPHLSALPEDERAAVRAKVAPLTATSTPAALAALAILFNDPGFAKEAVTRADDEQIDYRDPWPVAFFDVVLDGNDFAHLLSRGGASFQFYGAGYVLGARGRVPDTAIADALIRFFAAAMAEPRRIRDTYATRFAAVACTIPDPRLAWLFTEHGKHKWLKKHAPFYFARHPDVAPERPSDDALSARLVPSEPRKRPSGYSRAELAALTPAEREAKLLESFSRSNTNLQVVGHLGAMLVLDVLADHPIPAVAVALHEQIHSPDFSTQMPKPGFHKEIRADLAALAKKHPDMEKAILAAKKGKK